MYEIDKDKLPKGVRSITVMGEKPTENKNKSNTMGCNVLKIVPKMDWNLHRD